MTSSQGPRQRGILERHQALVLDTKGLPFGFPLRRLNGFGTMTALALGRVRPVQYSALTVKSQHQEHPLPSVVQLMEDLPHLPLNHIPPLSLLNLYRRDKGHCQYTGVALRIGDRSPYFRATIEHVIPRGQGGANTWNNVVLASSELNNRKGCLTPDQFGHPVLITPWEPTLADLLLIWLSTDMLTDLPPAWQEFVQLEDLRKHIIRHYPVHPMTLEIAA
jgi:5-methylcytosine-specific restriction endonuclease McrA